MNQTKIQTALDLHKKAYDFLLASRDSGRATSHPLDEATVEAWGHADSGAEWVTRHYAELPLAHRPEREEIPAFSQFLTSFFATSFSVIKTKYYLSEGLRKSAQTRLGGPPLGKAQTEIYIRAMPARRLDGTRKSKHAKEKEAQAAETLCFHNFRALAAECGADDSHEAFLRLRKNDSLAADLTLWTYAEQLVNRAQFASQGPSVYRLWLQIPENIRRDLSASLIWQARQRLLQFLQSTPSNH